jgi:hypothetical protein
MEALLLIYIAGVLIIFTCLVIYKINSPMFAAILWPLILVTVIVKVINAYLDGLLGK